MSKIDLSSPAIFTYSLSLITGFFAATTFAYAVGRLAKENNSALTSVMQGAGRHNTFIGLAVAGQLFGATGATIGTLATAALVPLSNVVAVVMMASMLNKHAGKRRIIQDIVRNPIILSIVAGLIFNAIDLDRDFVLYQFSELLGRATLPTLLLVIGANLRFAGVKPHALPSLVSIAAKMLVFPVVTLIGSISFGLSPEMTIIAVIFAACPTSTAAFPLAKQMGGDAPLMATIISIQTALAVIVIPIAILLAQVAT
jgi:predicted permease